MSTNKEKHGHLPQKAVVPWETLCVDMVAPYTILRKGKKDFQLWAVTMTDPATCSFKMARVSTKHTYVTANVMEQTWLLTHPWSQQVVLDKARNCAWIHWHDSSMWTQCQEEANNQTQHAGKCHSGTYAPNNWQHVVHTFLLHNNSDFDEEDLWSRTLIAAVAFGARATVHKCSC